MNQLNSYVTSDNNGHNKCDIYVYRPTPEYRVTDNPSLFNPAAEATTIPNKDYYIPSTKFSLSANCIDVPIIQYNRLGNNMDVSRFVSTDATPEFIITADTDITEIKIYPEMYYPKNSYKVKGNTLTFKMSPELRYTIIQINASTPYLAVINDPPEDSAKIPDKNASNVLNIMDFVTDNTGATDQTEHFKAAINTLYSEARYDTIYIPDGHYLYAGLEIRGTSENRKTKPITIYTEEGALLQNHLQDKKGPVMEPAIGIWFAENITFLGRGIFDGNGCENTKVWRKDAVDSNHQGGVMVVHSSNIKFEDTYIRDAKQWNWETHTAKNCTFINIKGLSPYFHSWVDGLDFASGQNLLADGAFTLGNDDIFASGHYNPDSGYKNGNTHLPENTKWDTEDSFNIVVKNHLGWSCDAGNGIRLGHYDYTHEIKDYTFINCHGINFRAGHKGLTIINPVIENIFYSSYESIVIENCSYDTSRIANENISILGLNENNRIKKVKIKNCHFSNERISVLKNIENLEIKQLHIAGKVIQSIEQANLKLMNITNLDCDF